MAMNAAGTHHKCTLMISPEEWAAFCEVADAHGLPVKTLMMKMMHNAVKHHKEKAQ